MTINQENYRKKYLEYLAIPSDELTQDMHNTWLDEIDELWKLLTPEEKKLFGVHSEG